MTTPGSTRCGYPDTGGIHVIGGDTMTQREQRWWNAPPRAPEPPAPAPEHGPVAPALTWSAVALAGLGWLSTFVARLADYPLVIMLGAAALLAAVAAAVVASRAGQKPLVVLAVVAALMAVPVLGVGFSARSEYQQIIGDLGR